jgi:DNA-binding transcriptional ArsR family regulator
LTGKKSPSTINRMVNHQTALTAIFAALADPTRRRILVRLSKVGEMPVHALSEPFDISPPAISRHLRVIEKARLIHRRREGRVHLIRARPDGLKPARKWLAQCAAGWSFSLDALDALIAREQAEEENN